jgi:hypothetical protein
MRQITVHRHLYEHGPWLVLARPPEHRRLIDAVGRIAPGG